MLIADRYEPCRHRRMLEVVLKACPESLMRSILGRSRRLATDRRAVRPEAMPCHRRELAEGGRHTPRGLGTRKSCDLCSRRQAHIHHPKQQLPLHRRSRCAEAGPQTTSRECVAFGVIERLSD